ncbi:hypothetical protein MYK68_01530 [Gordonia sp. PP30]|uniref:hypothetical protein n=1 Tax=Gordonia sp. PP30 TaxID=2935861 RepID=UPI001FFFA8A6|nr:hypothetical protein [Gordonia sp. PP30]UQE75343.1 hypothetical protein MYK68_01530 [Gordonia sp. PP30]
MSIKRKTMILTAAAALMAGVAFPAAGTAHAAESFVKMKYNLSGANGGMSLQIDNRGTGLAKQECAAYVWQGNHVDEIKRNTSFPTSLLNQSGKFVDAPVRGVVFSSVPANTRAEEFFLESEADGSPIFPYEKKAAIVLPATAFVSCKQLGDAVVYIPSGQDLNNVWVSGENLSANGSLDGIFG